MNRRFGIILGASPFLFALLWFVAFGLCVDEYLRWGNVGNYGAPYCWRHVALPGTLLLIISGIGFLGWLRRIPGIPILLGAAVTVTSLFWFSLGLGGIFVGLLMMLTGLAEFATKHTRREVGNDSEAVFKP